MMMLDKCVFVIFYTVIVIFSSFGSLREIKAQEPSSRKEEFAITPAHGNNHSLEKLSFSKDDNQCDKVSSHTKSITSPNPPPLRKALNWQDYVEASLVGAQRGIAGLPLEHPLDCVKTYLQSNLNTRSGILAAKNIYYEKGIPGFFRGVIPNGFRMTVKQVYRYPLMIYLPNFYQDILPAKLDEKNPALKKALTGVTLAGLETYFLCPLERLKVYLMTSQRIESHSILRFFSDNKSAIIPELGRGLNALFPKQLVSWVTFLVADHKIKELAHKWTNIPNEKELPFLTLMGAGTAVGIINTTAILPFDCAKTQLQMYRHLETTKLRDAVRSVYNEHGVMGLYRGWQVRMFHYILHSIFTVTVLDKLEKKYKLEKR